MSETYFCEANPSPHTSFIIFSFHIRFYEIIIGKRPFVNKKKGSNINGGLRAASVAAYVMKSRVTARDLIDRRSRGSRSGRSDNEEGPI